jgi:hypothetical protein
MRSRFLLAATLLIAWPAGNDLQAQVKCVLARQASASYVGLCLGQRPTPVRVELEPAASASGLWRGRSSDTTGYRVHVAIDTAARVYREFRGWFRLVDIRHSGDSLWYQFAQDSLVKPSEDDIKVLQRARAYLADSTRWSHDDDGQVEKVALQFYENPGLSRGGYCNNPRRTIVCALYHASIEVTGEYWWGGPYMNAVRAAILSENIPLRHPLMQYNGAPTTTHSDVQRILDMAIGYARERRNCAVQYWVWGNQPCR